MITEGIVAVLGFSHIIGVKRESVIEPFKRTLELASAEHDKARDELIRATEELANLAIEKGKHEDDSKS